MLSWYAEIDDSMESKSRLLGMSPPRALSRRTAWMIGAAYRLRCGQRRCSESRDCETVVPHLLLPALRTLTGCGVRTGLPTRHAPPGWGITGVNDTIHQHLAPKLLVGYSTCCPCVCLRCLHPISSCALWRPPSLPRSVSTGPRCSAWSPPTHPPTVLFEHSAAAAYSNRRVSLLYTRACLSLPLPLPTVCVVAAALRQNLRRDSFSDRPRPHVTAQHSSHGSPRGRQVQDRQEDWKWLLWWVCAMRSAACVAGCGGGSSIGRRRWRGSLGVVPLRRTAQHGRAGSTLAGRRRQAVDQQAHSGEGPEQPAHTTHCLNFMLIRLMTPSSQATSTSASTSSRARRSPSSSNR